MNEGIETQKEPQIEQFGDVDFNDESAPQRNDLRFASAEEALGSQPTKGDLMNEDNVEAPPMVDPPQTEVSQKQKETVAAIDDTYLPNKSLLLSFKFNWVRSIYLGQTTGCEKLRVTIEQMKKDITLNDVVHEQFIKSFEELLTKLEEKTKECEALNEQNAKLVKDLRIQAAVDDCNASLSRELEKKTKEYKVLNEQKTKLVEDLRIKTTIDTYNASLALELAKQPLDARFSSRGKKMYDQLRRACSYGGQHVEYRHMGHLLATCYEKVVVFISNHKTYTFLPLFWLRKNNHISNEKKFENLVGDTTKFWWVRLGSDNQYVRLFTRYEAPMPPVSTLWLTHVDLGLRGDF
ncbi:hypothetical protein GIB67_010990 [Kingdonia uniflora]|uniref:Uncharacterized protein n=1 Tax=Kingdonia uniflora TaxID=39325 RepID=A0A7J7MMF8_9MAGN|nr:hypothetical protein GIB67_010990 [Kingdonia uniflora]